MWHSGIHMDYTPTPRTAVHRLKKRGAYDKPTVHAILDEGFVCHVGFVVETQPYVIPTVYARDDERLYLHGAMASRMLRTLAEGLDVCVTVTLVDGLVLARSAFNHSINYRSVVALGKARLVDDDEDHALPHWAGVLPLQTRMADPVADAGVPAQAPEPHWAEFTRFAPPKP
jgi:nitroimidazol reductase NimA-like FMN-containing flavoprotein (pyridoxamine 5'-phosphate oxidase superfamily)